METARLYLGAGVLLVSFLLIFPPLVWGHCDTLEGPVITDAKAALSKGDITPILKWIPAAKEAELKAVFAQVLVVRGKGKEAQELADMYLFETLVRIHRESEGAPYTGIKAGGAQEETIVAADNALTTGKVDDLLKMVVEKVEHGIRHRLEETMEKKKHAEHDVQHGRAYVASYVEFVHYGERIYQDAENPPSHAHGSEGSSPEHKH